VNTGNNSQHHPFKVTSGSETKVNSEIAFSVLELQRQINNQLILIRSATDAISTQQLEMTENPTPSLSVVLLEEQARCNWRSWFRTESPKAFDL